jgi:hypothetical protein
LSADRAPQLKASVGCFLFLTTDVLKTDDKQSRCGPKSISTRAKAANSGVCVRRGAFYTDCVVWLSQTFSHVANQYTELAIYYDPDIGEQ